MEKTINCLKNIISLETIRTIKSFLVMPQFQKIFHLKILLNLFGNDEIDQDIPPLRKH